MKKRISAVLRRSLLSVFLSAGILSIANIDSIWREAEHQEKLVMMRVEKERQALKTRVISSSAEGENAKAALKEAMNSDEIAEGNPFIHLSSTDAIQQILAGKVTRFERQTYRSPHYQGESGYDLIHYAIRDARGETATILAYTEKPIASEEEPKVYVLIHVRNGESFDQYLYRSGDLISQSQVAPAVSQELVAQRLSAGVPLLSVAR